SGPGGSSEGNTGSNTDDQSIGDRPAYGRRCRRGSETARVENQLEIRLKQPPRRNARLVGDFEYIFVIAYRTLDASEEDLISVQAAHCANPPIACTNAQHVEFTGREQALEGEAGVDLEADQIAVGRGIAEAKEGSQSLGRGIGPPPQHLVHYQIRPEIPV